MGVEIERKFLVASDAWRCEVASHSDIRQAYLAVSESSSVRVRIRNAAAFLTIKSAGPAIRRDEFEYPIPLGDAEALLALRTGRLIEKRRYIVPHAGLRWEIDVFSGDLAGLVIAEIELPNETAPFARPAWLGGEVTDDARYANASLATRGPPDVK
ncbi:MAG: CYTH domain-containing protein [Proteobacteria bacterium]|nr:CYTH domain-containing protein [Pseudomonadota bacterium]